MSTQTRETLDTPGYSTPDNETFVFTHTFELEDDDPFLKALFALREQTDAVDDEVLLKTRRNYAGIGMAVEYAFTAKKGEKEEILVYDIAPAKNVLKPTFVVRNFASIFEADDKEIWQVELYEDGERNWAVYSSNKRPTYVNDAEQDENTDYYDIAEDVAVTAIERVLAQNTSYNNLRRLAKSRLDATVIEERPTREKFETS